MAGKKNLSDFHEVSRGLWTLLEAHVPQEADKERQEGKRFPDGYGLELVLPVNLEGRDPPIFAQLANRAKAGVDLEFLRGSVRGSHKELEAKGLGVGEGMAGMGEGLGMGIAEMGMGTEMEMEMEMEMGFEAREAEVTRHAERIRSQSLSELEENWSSNPSLVRVAAEEAKRARRVHLSGVDWLPSAVPRIYEKGIAESSFQWRQNRMCLDKIFLSGRSFPSQLQESLKEG